MTLCQGSCQRITSGEGVLGLKYETSEFLSGLRGGEEKLVGLDTSVDVYVHAVATSVSSAAAVVIISIVSVKPFDSPDRGLGLPINIDDAFGVSNAVCIIEEPGEYESSLKFQL